MPASLVTPYGLSGRAGSSSRTGSSPGPRPYSAAEPRWTSRTAAPDGPGRIRSSAVTSAAGPSTFAAVSVARSPLVAPAQFTTTSGTDAGDHRADRVRPAGEIERDVPGSRGVAGRHDLDPGGRSRPVDARAEVPGRAHQERAHHAPLSRAGRRLGNSAFARS